MNLRLSALLLIVYLLSSYASSGQIYVKSDASGNNDGTSWENAYVDLQQAIASAEPGEQIWIAAGTYLPAEAGAASTATFYINKQLEIYGGFMGSENNLEERNPDQNITRLSGDLLGDDIPGNDSLRRNDNIFNVLTLDSTISQETIIDGLNIEHGHANGSIEDNLRFGRGAGIFSYGAPIIRNCIISQNFAIDDGGGLYLSGLFTSGTQFINCRITDNRSMDDGGGLKVFAANGPEVRFIDCNISNNRAVAAGGGLHIKGTNAFLKGNLIESNTTEKFGGGVDVEQSLEFSNLRVTIDSCVIIRNSCDNIGGGLLYFSDREGNELLVSRSAFDSNRAVESGAGAYLQLWIINTQSTVNLRQCTFTGNHTILGSGGGLFYDVRAIDSQLEILESTFQKNSSALEGGAIQINLQRGGLHEMSLRGCLLEENISDAGGGIYIGTRNRSLGLLNVENSEFNRNRGNRFSGGSGALHSLLDGENLNIRVTSSRFNQNEGRSGGGVYVEVTPNSGGSLYAKNSEFINNQARNLGGGISFYLDGGRGDMTLENVLVGQNRSGVGGGLSYRSELGGEGNINVKGTRFIDNTAFQGAGGMLIQLPDQFSNTQITVDSCLFEKNIAEENVGGLAIDSASDTLFADITRSIFTRNQAPDFGGLYVQQSLGERSSGQINIANSLFSENRTIVGASIGIFSYPVKIINCTIAYNEAAGIDLIGESELVLQNNIFHNPNRFEFRALDTLGTVISLGGNLSSDVSMGNVLGAKDLQETNPLLVEDGEFSYRLSSESPALDAGIPTEAASDSDLAGNPRVQGAGIDIGAFEGSYITSTDNYLSPNSGLSIFPNPAAERLTTTLTNTWRGTISVRLLDMQGRTVMKTSFEKNINTSAFIFDTGKLRAGTYHLILSNGIAYLAKAFTKI